MYSILLEAHSGVRWFVVVLVLLSLALSVLALGTDGAFSVMHKRLRMAATTATHLQFVLGIGLWSVSPVARQIFRTGLGQWGEAAFFGLVHPLAMLAAVSLFTVGGSLIKRQTDDRLRHRTNVLYLLIGALVIFAAIPWPGSPLAERPWYR